MLLLVVLAWSLPFYEPPQPEAGDSFLAVPFARSGRPLVAAPVLRIDARAVTLDGRLLASSHDVVEHGEAALGLLGRDLETLQRNWRLLHRDVPPPGRLCVEASGATRWEVLRPVLLAAARAGYPHMAFIVRSGPFGAPPFDWARFAPTPREP